jgi:membrane fusion protein (multidrug efflux system)
MVKEKEHKMTTLRILIGAVIITLVSVGIYEYFKYDKLYPSTDDAYVTSNLVNVAPKVNGYIQNLNVRNNQIVHKGDLLFMIDPIDYQLSAEQAQKNYLSQVAMAETAKDQLAVQQSQTNRDKVQYKFLAERANRYSELYKANTISQQAYQNAITDFNSLKAQLNVDDTKYKQYLKMYQFAETRSDLAKTQLDAAKTNLKYTKYISPVDGYIANMNTLTLGEFISAGQQLFGIVDNDSWWIDANFKETQLARIKVGQTAQITLDMYEHKFTGVVDSISYASGNTFSLLPAQNATGNWVKVTQRFTVRIKMQNDVQYPLRVGASTKVKIDTTSATNPNTATTKNIKVQKATKG